MGSKLRKESIKDPSPGSNNSKDNEELKDVELDEETRQKRAEFTDSLQQQLGSFSLSANVEPTDNRSTADVTCDK